MVIGVLGGMGSYATLHFFKRFLKVFPAKKEWDRPRIVVDNNCTMPSRVVAALHGERRQELVLQMSMSVRNLCRGGATHVLLACNTSHIFLDEVINNVPEADGKILNIIETLADLMQADNCEHAGIIASEGTLQTGIYQKNMTNHGIKIFAPNEKVFPIMRSIIEDVKQDCITDKTDKEFTNLIKSFTDKTLILGCTEFPIMYERNTEKLKKMGYHIYDPLEATLRVLRTTYLNEINK